MTSREPSQTTNLDGYGNPPLEWARAVKALSVPPSEVITWFLGTAQPDGRPHAAGVGAMFYDGGLFFTSGPSTRKSHDLEANPACTMAVALDGIDLVFEGEAERITDAETLDRLAARYRNGGWPAQVENGALTAPFSAPSAGPAPWYLYRLNFETVVGVGSAEPNGATRWRFARESEQAA